MEGITQQEAAQEWAAEGMAAEGAKRAGIEVAQRAIYLMFSEAQQLTRKEEEFYARMQEKGVELDQPVNWEVHLVLTNEMQLQLEVVRKRQNIFTGRFGSENITVYSYEDLGNDIEFPTMLALGDAIEHAENDEIKSQKIEEQKALLQRVWKEALPRIVSIAVRARAESSHTMGFRIGKPELIGEYAEPLERWGFFRWLRGLAPVPHYKRGLVYGKTYTDSGAEYKPGFLLREKTNNSVRKGALRVSLGFQVSEGSEQRQKALKFLDRLMEKLQCGNRRCGNEADLLPSDEVALEPAPRA